MRCIGQRGNDGETVALSLCKVGYSLPGENALAWLILVGEKTGIGQDSEALLLGSRPLQQEDLLRSFAKQNTLTRLNPCGCS